MNDEIDSSEWPALAEESVEPLDPVTQGDETGKDLYGISTWEVRTTLDRVSTTIYHGVHSNPRLAVATVVSLLGVMFVAGVVLPFVIIPELQPFLMPFLYLTALSLVPALVIVGFIWFSDGTLREPIVPLAVTFVLGGVLAGIAAMTNNQFALLEVFGAVGVFLLFYLVVAPIEEIVKLAAVRVFAYRTEHFSAVIDGAVYGAAAGLGFAAIENFSYIGNFAFIVGPETITLVRSLSGPGHVIWSAIAGYYLGLAKYNPEHAGPIIVKGLLIAAFFHATHNFAANLIDPFGLGLWWLFQISWHGIALAYLVSLLWRYRNAYVATYEREPAPLEPKPALETVDIDGQMQSLTALYDSGVFTDEEFEQKIRELRGQL